MWKYVSLVIPVLVLDGQLITTGFLCSVTDLPPINTGTWLMIMHPPTNTSIITKSRFMNIWNLMMTSLLLLQIVEVGIWIKEIHKGTMVTWLEVMIPLMMITILMHAWLRLYLPLFLTQLIAILLCHMSYICRCNNWIHPSPMLDMLLICAIGCRIQELLPT